MKRNHRKLTGVQHQALNEGRYHLRRYFPNEQLSDLIEQFWLVNWDLRGEKTHTQKNLPDPNFHLILDNRTIKLIGPVSKAYSYTMEGTGKIIGIKFELGALSDYLDSPLSDYVNKELDIQELVSFDVGAFIDQVDELDSDEQIIDAVQTYLRPFAVAPSFGLTRAQNLVSLIKSDQGITRVEHLSERSNLAIRTIQRSFKNYIGLSPKWLIRKYRLHQALELLERRDVSFLDMVDRLGYTDQSHLIRDFKEIVGVTPNNYINQ